MQCHDKSWREFAAAALCVAVVALLSSGVIFGEVSHAGGKIFLEEWKLPKFYPRGFDGHGRLDMIFEDRLVISDTSRKLSSSVVYGTQSSSHASKSSFQAGNTVAYLFDQNREIVSLWLIK